MTAATDLSTAFQARYDTHTIRQWVRQNDPANADSIDTDKLTATATDAISRFELETGVAFEDASGDVHAMHTTAGVEIMAWLLMMRARSQERAGTHWSQMVQPFLDRIRKMRARPVTVDAATTNYDPTDAPRTQKPDFDEHGGFWNGVLPDNQTPRSDLEEINPF